VSGIIYTLYDLSHVALTPIRLGAEMTRETFQSAVNPISYTMPGRAVAAGADLAIRMTRRFDQPEFGIRDVEINGKKHKVHERHMMELPFCRLKHFEVKGVKKKRTKILVAAPLSGHFATLLRGTVEALLPHHDVYITDWKNARNVPLVRGYFDLDDCVEYYMHFMQALGPDVHVFAVCQPSVPVLLATTLMNQHNKKTAPRSIILMGGPIDTRINPTEVNRLAMTRDLEWFERNAISIVPPWYAGAMRQVYPGFLQLTGFLSMNFDRHIDSYFNYYLHLVQGDGQSVKKHREFYNEYLAVMDIPAEFYLQTVERVFQKHLLPKRQYKWRDEIVDPANITQTALLCIEGELDDISATGQTKAALDLCSNLPASMKKYHLQKKAGHYGLFSGTRWREEVRPLLTTFIEAYDHTSSAAKKKKILEKKIKPEENKKLEAKVKKRQQKNRKKPLNSAAEAAAIIG
jgi:poly(3-hydroxybutyrate) depolymerase